MPDLHFEIEGAVATPDSAVPQISIKVRVTNAASDAVHSVALRVQVQIEPLRRKYDAEEQKNLKELFGEPERWSQSLQPLLWSNVTVAIPAFTSSTTIEVPVPCTFDFNVAVTKYTYGLSGGELPTSLLFSGTVFFAGTMGLQIAQIPWDRSAHFRLPVSVWKEMMDRFYPNAAWISLRRDVFDRLYSYKSRHGIHTWEQTIEHMLEMSAEVKS